MNHFFKVLKITIGLPFFAICAVLVAIGGFLLNLLFAKRNNPKKEEARQDLNKRKEQYKKTSKIVAIDDVTQHIEASFNWDSSAPIAALDQKKRKKKKVLTKRRKRNKRAKKSRQQNRK
jgi:hypothetical protein